ncbi:MAG TPA: AAA family ATPase [Pirellulales bacterium]|nr:AAA family ATPase [Pirellulales bacterium]
MADLELGIRELTIENFRGTDHLQLSFIGPRDFPTPIAVLGGPNGCGKTTVLEACLLATGNARQIRGRSGPSAIHLGADDYQIRVVVQTREDNFTFHCNSTQIEGERSIYAEYYSSWRAPALPGPQQVSTPKTGAARLEKNRLKNIKQFLVNARNYDFYVAARHGDAGRPSKYGTVIDQLNSVWQMFYPGQSFTVEPIDESPDFQLEVFCQLSNGQRLAVDALSSGQIELFCFAAGMLTEPAPAGLVFIDEPELHLDPQWHATLLRAFRKLKPGSQLIIGTHSPDIYASVYSFERHFLLPADDPRAKAGSIRQPVLK